LAQRLWVRERVHRSQRFPLQAAVLNPFKLRTAGESRETLDKQRG
jgi:hypothetical protein